MAEMTPAFSPLRTAAPMRVRENETTGEANESASQLPVQASRLADYDHLLSVLGHTDRVGHAGHLLFESAMGRDAFGAGGGLRRVHDLGHLVFAPAAHARDGDRVVSRRSRMVDLHPPVTRPQLATGSRRDAASRRRR